MTCYNFMDKIDIFYKIYYFFLQNLPFLDNNLQVLAKLTILLFFFLLSSEIYQFILQII